MPKSVKKPSDAWPAAAVALVPTAELVPYARNARTHSDEQIAQIMASIREFGFTQPILRDETGLVIAGHGRLAAAQRLGLTEVPVVTARGWSEAKKRACVIADNKLALNAGWDYEMLSLELTDLQEMDFDIDMDALGFSDDELNSLLQFNADDAPEPVPSGGTPPPSSGFPPSGVQPPVDPHTADPVSEAPAVVGFQPTLDPTVESRHYTENDIQKTDARLQGRFQPQQKKPYRVVCPNCAEEFYIDI